MVTGDQCGNGHYCDNGINVVQGITVVTGDYSGNDELVRYKQGITVVSGITVLVSGDYCANNIIYK